MNMHSVGDANALKLSFNEIPFMDFWTEICLTEMVMNHWNEVGTFRDVLFFNPDYERYVNLEKNGMLHVLTARSGKRLVGYMTAMLTPHPRDKKAKLGYIMDMYCVPHFRKMHLGLKMQKSMDAHLTVQGANIIQMSERASHSEKPGRRGGYLERYGYKKIETVYAKVVKKPHGDRV
jgi:hypothetical protein